MNQDILKDLLDSLSHGRITVDETLDRLKNLFYEDIELACIDHHRSLRRGTSEIIFGEGKQTEDLIKIITAMTNQKEDVLVTRLSRQKALKIQAEFPDSVYHKRAKALTLIQNKISPSGRGDILVISAGTSDIPVAEEAAVTARFMGNRVNTIYDIGVAGIHRIMLHIDKIKKASVIIVVAGMEGALPSVVAGLVSSPVIAVPTSVGYGASFKGLSALLGMLNSCSAGVTVVNIDNGFGAGYAASLINRI